MSDIHAGSGGLHIAETVSLSIGPYETDRIQHAWDQALAGHRPLVCVKCGKPIVASAGAELILAQGASDTLAYAHTACLPSQILSIDVSETHDLAHIMWDGSLLGGGLPPALLFQRSQEAILRDEGQSVDEALWLAHMAVPIESLNSLTAERIETLPTLEGTYLAKRDTSLELMFFNHKATVAGIEIDFEEGITAEFSGLEVLPDEWVTEAASAGQVIVLIGTGGIAFNGAPGSLMTSAEEMAARGAVLAGRVPFVNE